MATDLGKVGIRMRGDWNSATVYEVLDAVSSPSGLYIAKQAVPAGTIPSNTAYWQAALDASQLIPDGINHNGIYRGRDVGTISSIAELEAFLTLHEVSGGKFTDLYLGDYITIQDGTYNKKWMIAGFGTEANKGSTNIPAGNTLTLFPSENITTAAMNSTNTTGVSQNSDNPLYATTGGTEMAGYQAYWGSDMSQIVLPDIELKLASVLGSHLITRDIECSTSINSATNSMAGNGKTGASSGWGWKSVKASLPTEVQLMGTTVTSSSFMDVGEGNNKLPLFNFIPVTYNRSPLWLRSVASATEFALLDRNGNASCTGSTYTAGIRPLIVIG